MALALRTMRDDDLPQVLAIEQAGSPAPWSPRIFHDCLREGHHCRVVEVDGGVAAFTIYSLVAGELHLFNIAVAPAQRRRGLARQMLTQVLNEAVASGCRAAWLEVRASNEAAITLYEQLGFIQVGVRKAYYPAYAGREDALQFSLEPLPVVESPAP